MVVSTVVLVGAVAAPLVFLLALRSAYHKVPEGDVEILLVFGEPREILEPRLYFVPPFVSATYPIDLQTMQYVTPHGRRSIPPEFRDRVETIATDRANADERRP